MDGIGFIHITDTHFMDRPEDTFHGVNTKRNFEKVLLISQAYYPDANFILLTGDISQTGTEKSYALFETVVNHCKKPVYCVPGNHDSPVLLQAVLSHCPDESMNVIDMGCYSLVLLNSWVAGKHHGMISTHCLQQLDNHLKASKGVFNVIAVHHPPVYINSRWLDDLCLQNQTEFLNIINRYAKTTLLMCGHVHQAIDLQLDKLRLLATPSTCHQYKANSDIMCCLETPSPAFRYVEVSAVGVVKTSVHYIE